MQLPAALEQTTLGDLLGTLHRGRAFGVLELQEWLTSRRHEIQFWDGQVVQVNVSRADTAPLGEVLCRRVANPFLPAAIHRATLRLGDRRSLGERLIAAGVVSREQLNDALLHLYCERLCWLEQLPRAKVRFRPLPGRTHWDIQLGPESFLHGRLRHRRRTQPAQSPSISAAARDYAALGIAPNASSAEIKRAFRAAVRAHHPDCSVHLGEKAALHAAAHFRNIVESYNRICSREGEECNARRT